MFKISNKCILTVVYCQYLGFFSIINFTNIFELMMCYKCWIFIAIIVLYIFENLIIIYFIIKYLIYYLLYPHNSTNYSQIFCLILYVSFIYNNRKKILYLFNIYTPIETFLFIHKFVKWLFNLITFFDFSPLNFYNSSTPF